ncbi:beta strand repeat-containing protein, partial [Azohydromonas lata]
GIQLTRTGSLSVSDTDAGQDKFSTTVSNTTSGGAWGALTINAAGTWSYAVDNSLAALQALKQGETHTETFTVQSLDGTASQTVTIVVTGVNDAATIDAGTNGVNAQAALTEDADTDALTPGIQLTRTGSLSVSDTDAGQDKFSTTVTDATVGGAWGALTINAAGTWSYTVDNSLAALQALKAGETHTETFTVQSLDGTASQTVTIVITGVNDAATIDAGTDGANAQAALTEDADTDTVTPGIQLTRTGSLAVSDTDAGQDKFSTTVTDTTSGGAWGALTINAAGTWSYTVDNSLAALQALKAGETHTETFTVQSLDGTASQTVTIVITGVNDAATIDAGTDGANAQAALTEDADTDAGTPGIQLTRTGSLSVSDTDAGQDKFSTTVTDTTSGGAWGALTINAAGTWSYTVDNSLAALQALKQGETHTETFTVQSLDGTATQTVTVVITGVNDAATIDAGTDGANAQAALTEDADTDTVTPGIQLTRTGSLSVSDTDASQDKFSTTVTDTTVGGAWGALTINAAGAWSYSVDNSLAALQALKQGETHTETFTVQSLDGTATQTITIVITGVNDAATIDAGTNGVNAQAALTEDADTDALTPGIQLTRTGSLSVSDTDAGQDKFSTTVTDTTSGGAWGALTINAAGTWSYTVDNSLAALQALKAGETHTETFSVASLDGTASQTVTIVITGVNDAATIDAGTDGANAQAALTEDADTDTLTAGIQLTRTGSLAVSDADAGQDKFSTTVTDTTSGGAWGALTINAAGTWSYAVDNSLATLQALKQGETHTETFTVQSRDGTASQTVTIVITGVNDAATIDAGTDGANAQAALTEDADTDTLTPGIQLTRTGSLSVSDTDAGQDKFSTIVTDTTVGGAWGALTINAAGAWSYSVDNSLTALQALKQGETHTETFTVQSLDGTATQTVTIVITGVNDAATIDAGTNGANAQAALTEDADTDALTPGIQLTRTGSLTVSDTDAGQDKFSTTVTDTASGGAWGALTIDAAGTWSYAVDNSLAALQALKAGETHTETFTVQSLDGTASQTVTIVITGVNDAATIDAGTDGANAQAALTEDADTDTLTPGIQLTRTGSLSVSDSDAGQNKFSTTVTDTTSGGAWGALTINAAGTWSYEVDNSLGALQALKQGETHTETFTVQSLDGTATQTITIVITGVNDAATIDAGTDSANAQAALTEDADTDALTPGIQLTRTGSLAVSDTDAGQDKFSTTVTDTTSGGAWGSLTINAAGAWSY